VESQGLFVQDINLLHLPSLRHPRNHYYTLRGHSNAPLPTRTSPPPVTNGIAIRDNAKKREGLLEEEECTEKRASAVVVALLRVVLTDLQSLIDCQ
jgi:hypothetical protein